MTDALVIGPSLLREVRAARQLPAPRVRKAVRLAAGVSQQRLADELKVGRVTVARWESNARNARSPRGQLLIRYSHLLASLAAELSQ